MLHSKKGEKGVMTENIVFLETRPNGRGASLFTLPGQKTGVRKKLLDNMMTHGCENVRRKHPVGTVFYTDGSALRFRRGCYHTDTLFPLLSPDGKPIELTLEFQQLLEKYRTITNHETD